MEPEELAGSRTTHPRRVAALGMGTKRARLPLEPSPVAGREDALQIAHRRLAFLVLKKDERACGGAAARRRQARGGGGSEAVVPR